MVLAVPPEHWPRLQALCDARGGRGDRPRRSSSTTGRLTLRYQGEVVGDLSMDFLHDGRPAVVRTATFTPPPEPRRSTCPTAADYTADLLAILGTLGRLQQGMDRPPVRPRGPGAGPWSSRWSASHDDGPGDASVVLPVRGLDPGPGDLLRDQPALRPSSTPTRWPAA